MHGGKHNLFIKLGGGTLGFIGKNLGRAKGKIFFFFFFCLSYGFDFYYGVSRGIRSGSFS